LIVSRQKLKWNISVMDVQPIIPQNASVQYKFLDIHIHNWLTTIDVGYALPLWTLILGVYPLYFPYKLPSPVRRAPTRVSLFQSHILSLTWRDESSYTSQ